MTLFPAPALTGSRFWVRHIHQTCATFVEEQLTALGWVDDPVNFGTLPVVFQEIDPEVIGENDLAPNTVSITLGEIPEEREEELGAGWVSLSVPIFVDIYGAKHDISVSIADDVRRAFSHNAITLYDFTNDPPVPFGESYIDFENVIGPRRPPVAADASDLLKRNWRVVKALAITYLVP